MAMRRRPRHGVAEEVAAASGGLLLLISLVILGAIVAPWEDRKHDLLIA
jgi:hypothetical protein